MKLSKLEEALRESWDRETCYQGCVDGWTPNNPAWGQCAVTALIVQDYLGGEVVWTFALFPDRKTVSHYFNKIDGNEIDLTYSQFPEGIVIQSGLTKNLRDYLSPICNFKKRYELLKQRVEEYFNKNPSKE